MAPLDNELAAWDGKSADDIRAVYQQHRADSDLFVQLVRCAAIPAQQNGATWLIKHHLESKQHPDPATVVKLLTLLPALDEWEAQLHVLQSLEYLQIPASCTTLVEAFTKASVASDNKFVRAWGYSGFYELARQHPEYQAEALALLQLALDDEPASVKARVRKVLARGF